MPIRISEALNIKPKQLEKHGVFNGFIDIDSQFYIDPRLLELITIPQLSNSHTTFRNYFNEVIKILDSIERRGDRSWREAYKRLIFREPKYILLGYSQSGNPGSGIGPGIARGLIDTAHHIVKAGIKDPQIFELIGLFEEGIGADRISDMTIRIILEGLLQFTESVSRILKLKSNTLTFRGIIYKVPYLRGINRPFIFLPSELLTPLPVAYSWEDIDIVCSHNEQLRNRVNEIIGDTWKKATGQRVSKSQLKATLLRYPELIEDLLNRYKIKEPQTYDFNRDPSGEFIWHDIAQKVARRYPLNFTEILPVNSRSILDLVLIMCNQFADFVEKNGLFRLLYDDNRKLKKERAAQLLFFGIADAYCAANDLDLSREPNAGKGSVDFKISKGYEVKVNVEIKYTSNHNLTKGYSKQLPAYNEAEKTDKSVYIVIRTTDSDRGIKELLSLKKQQSDDGRKAPEIVITDGRWQDTASKL
jgi:hypothetical protein